MQLTWVNKRATPTIPANHETLIANGNSLGNIPREATLEWTQGGKGSGAWLRFTMNHAGSANFRIGIHSTKLEDESGACLTPALQYNGLEDLSCLLIPPSPGDVTLPS